MSVDVVVLEDANAADFQEQLQAHLNEGYKIEACSCGFINSENYDFASIYQAVLVKESDA